MHLHGECRFNFRCHPSSTHASNFEQTLPVSGDRSRITREISEPSTPPETLESRLLHQLDLRLVATAASAKAFSNEMSAPIDGSGICSSVGNDDGSGNDVNAMHRTEQLRCVSRMTSFNRTNYRTVEISAVHKIVILG